MHLKILADKDFAAGKLGTSFGPLRRASCVRQPLRRSRLAATQQSLALGA
jgi:hypothetical protein